MAKVKITQMKGTIRTLENQRRTLTALGLRGIRKSVIQEKTAQLKGMLTVVEHLVKVEDAQ